MLVTYVHRWLPLLTMMLAGIHSVPQGPPGSYLPPTPGGGSSPAQPPSNTGHPDEWAGDPVNYEFSYEVQDDSEGLNFGHREMRNDNSVTGTYHVLLPDGRMQIVDYIADHMGFRPTIRFEGTATYPAPAPRPPAPPPLPRLPAPAPAPAPQRPRDPPVQAQDETGYKY